MNVIEINAVKEMLDTLKESGEVEKWELPYENLLTRLTAAIFFITPKNEESLAVIEASLSKFEDFSYRENEEKKLSSLKLRVTFNKEEKDKNSEIGLEAH